MINLNEMLLIQALLYFSILIIVLLAVVLSLLAIKLKNKNNTLLEINKLLKSNTKYLRGKKALPDFTEEELQKNPVIADTKNLLAMSKIVIERETELVDLVLNSIDPGALIIDCSKKISRINENILNSFYLKKDEVLGRKTAFVFKNEKLEKSIGRVLDKPDRYSKKITFYGDEDRSFLVEIIPINSGTRLYGEKCKELLILFENITQEVEFSRLRSQFVANISHEMRTPLTSIRGYIDTILNDESMDRKKVKDYLGRSLEEVERLNFLIRDVLNLSNIEFKRNVLFEKEYNLVYLIEETIKSLNFLAEKNETKISFNCSSDLINYQTDEELFTRMVRNIIENSIFYGGKRAEVNVDLKEDRSNILITIRDNGRGIDKDELPYIFQRFYRGKSSKSSRQIGSGLGLSIVKHTVELHKGRINARSAPGKETVFEIIMPKK